MRALTLQIPDDVAEGLKRAAADRGERVQAGVDGRSLDAPQRAGITDETLVAAAGLVRTTGLRAAGAISTRDTVPECDPVLCCDRRLAAAAGAVGVHVLPKPDSHL